MRCCQSKSFANSVLSESGVCENNARPEFVASAPPYPQFQCCLGATETRECKIQRTSVYFADICTPHTRASWGRGGADTPQIVRRALFSQTPVSLRMLFSLVLGGASESVTLALPVFVLARFLRLSPLVYMDGTRCMRKLFPLILLQHP